MLGKFSKSSFNIYVNTGTFYAAKVKGTTILIKVHVILLLLSTKGYEK